MNDLNIFRDAAKKHKADLSVELVGDVISVEFDLSTGGVKVHGVGGVYKVITKPFIKDGKIVAFQDVSDLDGLPDLLLKALRVASGELYIDSKGGVWE